MEEYEKVLKRLKGKEFAAELSNGKFYETDKNGTTMVLKKLREDEDFLIDAVVACQYVDKALALLLVYGNISDIYAEYVSEDALEVFEEFGIECEFKEKVRYIGNISIKKSKKGKFEKKSEISKKVKKIKADKENNHDNTSGIKIEKNELNEYEKIVADIDDPREAFEVL